MINAAPAVISQLAVPQAASLCTSVLLGDEYNEQITFDETSLIQGF